MQKLLESLDNTIKQKFKISLDESILNVKAYSFVIYKRLVLLIILDLRDCIVQKRKENIGTICKKVTIS